MTIQCELIEFNEVYPLPNKETVTVARIFFQNFILHYGIPNKIATDRGTEFIRSTIEQICKLLSVEKISSTAYDHEYIGALENAHKNSTAVLRTHCIDQQESWSYW